MRICEAPTGCKYDVFGTDKKTKRGYCLNHQHLRTDIKRYLPKTKLNRSANKESSLPSLIVLADKLFADDVKEKAADENGYAQCFTCDCVYHLDDVTTDNKKIIQLGHYTDRKYYRFRWDIDNCKVQCIYCNQGKGGNIKVFAEKLGQRLVDRFEEGKRKTFKLTRTFVLSIIKKYSSS